MDYAGRQARLRESSSGHGLDAILITHLPNISYLCGFTGSAAVLLLLESGSIFFTDGRYTEQAEQEVKGARVVVARKAPFTAATEYLSKLRKPRGNHKHRVGV